MLNKEVLKPYIHSCTCQAGYEHLLEGKGEKVKIGTAWVGRLMCQMGLASRKGTNAAQKLAPDREAQGTAFAASHVTKRWVHPAFNQVNIVHLFRGWLPVSKAPSLVP